MNRPLVLLDAAPFCFGPVSTLQVVLDELPVTDLDLILLSSGTTAEFMADYDPKCVQVTCDTENRDELARHNELFQKCALFVSNTNPVSARYAIEVGTPVLYLDTLFWMWDKIDPLIAKSAIYVAQSFRGIEENRRRIGRDIADFRIVGPLVRPARARERNRDCLISYGGMSSKLTVPGVTNRYAWVMTRLLLSAFERAPAFDRYVFRGNARVMDALAREFKDNRCEFGFAPHAKHVEEMAGACNVLLSPGLTGTYEALASYAPTWLLPPQNYSQQLQAEFFLNDGAFQGRHWGHIYPDFELPAYVPEPEGVRRVSAAVLRFEEDAEAQNRYVAALSEALPISRPALVGAGADVVGSGAAAQVANMIMEAVAGPQFAPRPASAGS